MSKADFQKCAELISSATGLLVTAGAGMGVDSGLPDFRGSTGFWNHYPALGKQRMGFTDIANPAAFRANPELAWGFYGHRLNLYRKAVPHQGFEILREIGGRMSDGMFVFTSNVDGQFQKAGFDPSNICEVHGSIHFLQCMENCAGNIWPADDFQPRVDNGNCLLLSPLPRCTQCGGVVRPNILMFDDWGWNEQRTARQQREMGDWLERVERLLVIELGAGTAIPSVRMMGAQTGAPLIRINPREPAVSRPGSVGLAMTALEGMQGIRQALLES